MDLGTNVIALMNDRGMGMNELARATGVSSATISKLKNNPEEANPNLSTIRDLAEELGIEAWMLLAMKPPIAPIPKGSHLKEVSHLGYTLLREFEKASDTTKANVLQQFRMFLQIEDNNRDAAKRLLDAQDKYLGQNT